MIRVTPDPALARDEAAVAVRTGDGREFRVEHRGIRGGRDDPLSWCELSDKFAASTARFLKDAAVEEIVARLDTLDRQLSLTPITDLLLDAS